MSKLRLPAEARHEGALSRDQENGIQPEAGH